METIMNCYAGCYEIMPIKIAYDLHGAMMIIIIVEVEILHDSNIKNVICSLKRASNLEN
jgi:hypothetical protein